MIAPGIGFAVRYDVEAKLTFGTFNPPIGFSGRHTHLILELALLDRSCWDCFNGLLNDANALADLVQPDQVAIVDVTVVTHSNIKVETIVNTVRVSPAEIIGDPRSSQDRPTGRIRNCLLRS